MARTTITRVDPMDLRRMRSMYPDCKTSKQRIKKLLDDKESRAYRARKIIEDLKRAI